MKLNLTKLNTLQVRIELYTFNKFGKVLMNGMLVKFILDIKETDDKIR